MADQTSQPSPPAALPAGVTPQAVQDRQALLDDAFRQLDLYSTSKRFRDKIDKTQGSPWPFLAEQMDILLLVCHEFALMQWQVLLCLNDPGAQQAAMQNISLLSLIAQRYTVSRTYVANMMAREGGVPLPPGKVEDLPPGSFRTLPDAESWEAMFK